MQYMYKMSCKMDRNILRYSMFFHRGPTSPSPASTEIFKIAQPWQGSKNQKIFSYKDNKWLINCWFCSNLKTKITYMKIIKSRINCFKTEVPIIYKSLYMMPIWLLVSDLLWKSMDWFLYDSDLRHESVNEYTNQQR